MILAAGLGTRLQSLSVERPKPMLPVCDQPLVRWVAQWLQQSGARRLAVNLHHLGEQIRDELGDGSTLGVPIVYSPEAEILGTGGGIRQMARLLPRETVVVANGKIITDVDLEAVVAFHRERGALSTVVLYEVEDPERWGALGTDAQGGLTRLLERRRGAVSFNGMFTGIHVLEPEFIDAIPEGPCCVIRTAYTTLFEAGAPLAGYVHRGYFFEHSTPARYLQGNVNLLRGDCVPPGAPRLLQGIDPAAQIDATAEITAPVLIAAGAVVAAGARVGPHAVVGRGARITESVQLQQSVVWPTSMVDRDAVRQIITPLGRWSVDES